jgi:phage tail tape-measure protein
VQKKLAEGKITKEEAGRRKTQETSEGAGQAIGGAGGALAGAAAGAAIGSVVPIIGTAIGGIIGGIAGAWLGSKGGEEIGGAIGEKLTISPEQKEQNEQQLRLVEQMGIYNENWLGASEVSMEN